MGLQSEGGDGVVMGVCDVTFSCLGTKRTWAIDAFSKEDARERLLNRLYEDLGLFQHNVIIHKIEKRQPWICTLTTSVVYYLCSEGLKRTTNKKGV